jgi:hypothetical protein
MCDKVGRFSAILCQCNTGLLFQPQLLTICTAVKRCLFFGWLRTLQFVRLATDDGKEFLVPLEAVRIWHLKSLKAVENSRSVLGALVSGEF